MTKLFKLNCEKNRFHTMKALSELIYILWDLNLK